MRKHKDCTDRVRCNTDSEINERIDQKIADCVLFYATQGHASISRRITELDREWDIERILEMNASALAFFGVGMSLTTGRRAWLALPATVLPLLFLHATQGWCPPVPLLRRAGVRTREEIDREKYALKALRGDFDGVSSPPPHPQQIPRALESLAAVSE